MDLALIGCDGTRWDIHGRRAAAQGVALLQGTKKLWEAPIKSVWMQSSFQEGATYLGYKTEPLDLVLVFGIRASSPEGWQRTDNRFRIALGSPDDNLTIEATSSSGVRRLSVKLMDTPEMVGDHDEHHNSFSEYIIQFRAGWPRWVADAATSVWEPSSGQDAGEVEISNPTDTWLYPQWALSAPGRWTLPDFAWPMEDASSRLITTPTLATGQDLTIDTYPANEPYVAADGSNIAGRFGGVMFLHAVPPHTPPTLIPVSVAAGSGESGAMLRMPRNYRRPWGGDQ